MPRFEDYAPGGRNDKPAVAEGSLRDTRDFGHTRAKLRDDEGTLYEVDLTG